MANNSLVSGIRYMTIFSQTCQAVQSVQSPVSRNAQVSWVMADAERTYARLYASSVLSVYLCLSVYLFTYHNLSTNPFLIYLFICLKWFIYLFICLPPSTLGLHL